MGFGDVFLAPQLMDAEGRGEVTIRDLFRTAIRMLPTRIVLGEVRGAEALDMLLAMNAGYEGSMCTIHAADAMGALQKLRTYVMMADEMPADAITAMLAGTIHVVVHLQRNTVGRREVASVYEVMNDLDHAGVRVHFVGREMFARHANDLVWSRRPSAHGTLLRRGALYNDDDARPAADSSTVARSSLMAVSPPATSAGRRCAAGARDLFAVAVVALRTFSGSCSCSRGPC